jgi:hypothetical protein
VEKPDIMTMDVPNFNVWYETFDPIFSKISQQSNIPLKWIEFWPIRYGQNKNSPIKPINRYVERLYPKPKLIDITNNIVRLRQGNHAEIILLVDPENRFHSGGQDTDGFYNVDRPWMRQYYQSKLELPKPDNCFDPLYKFYVPWFPDADVTVHFEPSPVDTPFHTFGSVASYTKVNVFLRFAEPHFVPFYFKKEGAHMESPVQGRILRQSAMYDMVFHADDALIERIRKQYEEEE